MYQRMHTEHKNTYAAQKNLSLAPLSHPGNVQRLPPP
jgi:hypothetical protein